MADTDWTDSVATAQELIDENGRDVTLIRFNQTPADANKPWAGPADPDATPDATTTVRGCFVPMSGSGLGKDTIDEDLLKRTSELCLIGPGVGFDITTANELIDGTVHKKITFVQELKPAATVLMYYVGVER